MNILLLYLFHDFIMYLSPWLRNDNYVLRKVQDFSLNICLSGAIKIQMDFHTSMAPVEDAKEHAQFVPVTANHVKGNLTDHKNQLKSWVFPFRIIFERIKKGNYNFITYTINTRWQYKWNKINWEHKQKGTTNKYEPFRTMSTILGIDK